MKKALPILIILFYFPVLCFGNKLSWVPVTNTDSLRNILNTATGKQKVDALNELCYALHKLAPEEAFTHAEEALKLAKKLHYNEGKSNAYWLLSFSNTPAYTIENSIRYQKLSQKYFDQETHWTMKYRIWNALGFRYTQLEKYDSAIVYYRKIYSQLPAQEAKFKRVRGHYYSANVFKLQGDYENEGIELTKLNKYMLDMTQMFKVLKSSSFFSFIEKLGAFYTLHGYYAKSIKANRKVLNKLKTFDLKPVEYYYQEAKFLGHIARGYSQWGKYDSALVYHDKSYEKFMQSNFELHKEHIDKDMYYFKDWAINLANQLEGKAFVQIYLGSYDSSEANFKKSIELREEKNDVLGVAMCMDGLGELYKNNGKHEKALYQYQQALEIKNGQIDKYMKSHGELKGKDHLNMIRESISITLLGLGKLYEAWGKQALALEEYQNSLSLCTSLGYIKGEAEAHSSIGNTYLARGDYGLAINEFKKSIRLYHQIENRPGIANTLVLLGDYFHLTNQADSASYYYHQSLDVFNEIGMQPRIASVLEKTANLHFKEKEFAEAIEEYKRSISIASSLGLQEILMKANYGISTVYSKTGDVVQAFRHYRNYIAAKDSIFTIVSNKQIAEIAAQFESKHKEQRISLLEKENELSELRLTKSNYVLFGFGGLVVIILLVSLLFIRQNRLKTEQKTLLLEQKLLRSQMNPHFIFNALTNIQSFMYIKDIEKADRYLFNFASLMRNILDSSRAEYINLSTEIQTLTNYLELQKLRFGEKCTYSIELDEAIDPEIIGVPPMIAQPFIENAIEHGIQQKKGIGHVSIRILKKGDFIHFEIKDNGIGREKAREIAKRQNKNHKSHSTNITKERFIILNKKRKQKITMEITDLKDDKQNPTGTKVTFIIPV
jgi:tetratricopeptide (TPR) repeat protein